MTREPLIQIDGLKKYFVDDDSLYLRLHPNRNPKYVRAVDDVDLTVHRGETLGLVGESGCGKSTLARTMLRLLEPTDGRIVFRGENIVEYNQSDLRGLRKDIQMIFQDPFASLNPRYTIQRTLTEPMKTHGIGDSKDDRIQRATSLLSEVGLNEEYLNRYPHEFSGGQRQRIALARALAVDPDVIVADEPTSALDVSVQAQILNLITEKKEERDLTLLFISHDLSVVSYVSDRVAVMYVGEIIEAAETEELFNDPKHPYTRSLLSSVPVLDPSQKQKRNPLRGEVPNPIDPPSGCRFHTRCPQIIPPADWTGEQTGWRGLFFLKKSITDGDLGRNTIELELDREVGETDDEMGSAIEEYLDRALDISVPDQARKTVRRALEHVLNDERERAVELVERSFETPCETKHPHLQKDGDGHFVSCHLYDWNDAEEPAQMPIPQDAER